MMEVGGNAVGHLEKETSYAIIQTLLTRIKLAVSENIFPGWTEYFRELQRQFYYLSIPSLFFNHGILPRRS